VEGIRAGMMIIPESNALGLFEKKKGAYYKCVYSGWFHNLKNRGELRYYYFPHFFHNLFLACDTYLM
jgi:hypothetical protein